MKTVYASPITNGYDFFIDQQLIATGEYGDGMFVLMDSNETTEHCNGMVAMSYLSSKYIPEYSTFAAAKAEAVVDVDINQYRKHPALKDITLEVMHAHDVRTTYR